MPDPVASGILRVWRAPSPSNVCLAMDGRWRKSPPTRVTAPAMSPVWLRSGGQHNGDYGTTEIGIVANNDPPTVCLDDASDYR